jgi:hypothetical protein
MAEHDYVIANQTGAPTRTDVNNALAAVVTTNSKATAPSTTYAWMHWADTTAAMEKVRNAANSAWLNLYQVVSGAIVWQGSERQLLAAVYDTGGTTTAYTITPAALAAYTAGEKFWVRPNADATGNITLNRDGLGAKSVYLYNSGGSLVQATVGDWRRGSERLVFYDGTQYIIIAERLHRGTAAGNIPQRGTDGTVPLVHPMMVYEDQKASGTDGGGNGGSSVWRTRTCDDLVGTNQIAGSSNAASVFTLPAGTYRVQASAPFADCGLSQTRWRNTTDSTTAAMGTSGLASTANNGYFVSTVDGVFTIAGTKNFELQGWVATSVSDGAGKPASTGEVEVYARVVITRLAT